MGASFFAVDNQVLQQIGKRDNDVLLAAFREFTGPMIKRYCFQRSTKRSTTKMMRNRRNDSG